jgi:hypothetical protein
LHVAASACCGVAKRSRTSRANRRRHIIVSLCVSSVVWSRCDCRAAVCSRRVSAVDVDLPRTCSGASRCSARRQSTPKSLFVGFFNKM